MVDDQIKKVEIDETLETTDDLHMDLARLKRLDILTAEEREENQHHVDAIVEALEEKRPD